MISDERAEKALRYLAESDERAADLFTEAERLEHLAKAAKDTVFLHETGTIPERQAKAGNHQDYKLAMDAYFVALSQYKAVANKRSTEELVVRAWQTVSSNRRQGNV